MSSGTLPLDLGGFNFANLTRHTLAFFGNFRSEIQTWESTSFGAKLGKKRGNQQVFTK